MAGAQSDQAARAALDAAVATLLDQQQFFAAAFALQDNFRLGGWRAYAGPALRDLAAAAEALGIWTPAPPTPPEPAE